MDSKNGPKEPTRVTDGHFDHFYGLSILLDRFPKAHTYTL
jgi:hypothetical protein